MTTQKSEVLLNPCEHRTPEWIDAYSRGYRVGVAHGKIDFQEKLRDLLGMHEYVCGLIQSHEEYAHDD